MDRRENGIVLVFQVSPSPATRRIGWIEGQLGKEPLARSIARCNLAQLRNVCGTQWRVIIDPVEMWGVPFLYQLQFHGPCRLALPVAQPMEKKGTTPYVTHFIFRPWMSIDIPGLGTATNLEAVGTTQNMKGEKMLDKMSARCAALSVASGDKKYIDGACVLTDSDGDQIFSTFDARDTDKSQPQMNCGTHIITGGTGKYKGITGSEPFACITMPALAGPGGYTAMDIPHNTTWEIK